MIPTFDLGLLQRFSRLSRLWLEARVLENLGAFAAAVPLKSLSIGASPLRDFVVHELCQVAWPNLVELELRFGASPDDPVMRLEETLHPRNYPALKKLVIAETHHTEQVFAQLVRSPILPQLEELHVVEGDLEDAVPLLVEHHEQLAHLKALNIEDNQERG